MYCSAACKQKAYRKAKRARDKAQQFTVSFDVYELQMSLFSIIGETLAARVGDYFFQHGKVAYSEMLYLFRDLVVELETSTRREVTK
jgi:hypothetical protein